ncbi:MAG: DUF4373 domain-containing protein [Bacteroidaceae bacterium]|nr:DUF4373 domain-containing protein [Bacteroidaceae bacterium]
MARPIKTTVEWFPHFTKSGRTIFILEQRFGNDGYAFWFKLLELLCDSERQQYDCNQQGNWQYLIARSLCSEDQVESMLQTLVELGKIDSELWQEKRIIWVQNLVNNLSPIYAKRKEEIPNRKSFSSGNPVSKEFPTRKLSDNNISDAETPQSTVQYSTVQEKIEKESIHKRKNFPYQEIAEKWNLICGKKLPRVNQLSDSRKAKIRSRLNEWGGQEAWIPTAEALFETIAESHFLTGGNNNSWTATFDWVFNNSTNWMKVMDGNYNDKCKMNAISAPSRQYLPSGGTSLGAGEYIDGTGRRTYGTGRATVPNDAPPRPSEQYAWNSSTNQWTIL